MNTNLDLVMMDFEDVYKEDPAKAAADADFILRDPDTNRARVAFLLGVRRSAGGGADPGDYTVEIGLLCLIDLIEALYSGKITPGRLGQLLRSPEGLCDALERLAWDKPGEVNPAEDRAEPADLARFVEFEVKRLASSQPVCVIYDRATLRSIRDKVAQAARTAGLRATAEDDWVFHVTLAEKIRYARRQNASVTKESGGTEVLRRQGQKTLDLLDAQDRTLSSLRADEEFSLSADWFQLAEDASLLAEEIAAISGEDPSVVQDTLDDVHAQLQEKLDHPRR